VARGPNQKMQIYDKALAQIAEEILLCSATTRAIANRRKQIKDWNE